MQFTFNGATVHLKPLTVGDSLDAEIIADVIGELDKKGIRARYRRVIFSRFLVSVTSIDGEFPITLPDIDAPADELYDAYSAWNNADPELLTAWRNMDSADVTKKKKSET